MASYNLHATNPDNLWPLGTFLLYLPSRTQRWSSTQLLPVFSMLFTDLQMKGFVLTSCTNNCRLLVQHCVISWSLVPSKRQMWGYARWTYTPRKTRSESNNCELLCKRSTSNRIRTQTHIYAIRNRITFLFSVFGSEPPNSLRSDDKQGARDRMNSQCLSPKVLEHGFFFGWLVGFFGFFLRDSFLWA